LPENWKNNDSDVISFRYQHDKEGEKDEEFYFKFMQAGDNLEINALSSKHQDDIFSTEFE
jgi:hypothetical protein